METPMIKKHMLIITRRREQENDVYSNATKDFEKKLTLLKEKTSDAGLKMQVALKEEVSIKAELESMREIMSKQAEVLAAVTSVTRLSVEGLKS